MSMNQEQRENARLVHKDFFDKCKTAIDNGYYLEAIIMEYAAMEARMNVIMSLFEKPCSLCKDTTITHRIGLQNKMKCFKEMIKSNNELFAKSKITNAKMNDMIKWCNERNNRIHGLYTDTEKYGTLVAKNKRCAEKGFVYCRLIYNETERLKRRNKKEPELLKNIKHECHADWEACMDAKKSIM